MSEYEQSVAELGQTHPDLAHEIGPFKNLERVLDWMKRRGLPLSSLDMVTQDEFNHDLLIPLDSNGEFLVFGMS